ncbi:ribosome biogenesis GTP-binding protein YihA/YsxC, partial [Lactobacillus helveticus]
MIIKSSNYAVSAVREDQYPKDNLPEIALSGRSNVGKSSLINTLLNRKNLARTSSQPGKTQTLNFYLINDEFYLVDVPGYGYARVSQKKRQEFGEMIQDYLETRPNLKGLVIVIDSRHEPTKDDIAMYNYAQYLNLHILVVCTKIDKIKKSQVNKVMSRLKKNIDLNYDYVTVLT